jgi:2-oxoglutarate ferredoxin oxidoreductase subunit alpha
MVIVNVQRGGPSTGLPTKVEQSDLLQASVRPQRRKPHRRVGPHSPADCFDIAIEACRLAVRSMSPVMILSDGFLANSSEPWMIPDAADIEPIGTAIPKGIASDGASTADAPFFPTCATRRRWLARGPSPARPDWNIASAV